MLIYGGGNITPCNKRTTSVYDVAAAAKSKATAEGKRSITTHLNLIKSSSINTRLATTTASLLAAAVICLVPVESIAIQPQPQPQEQMDSETLSNIPQTLSPDDSSNDTNNNRAGRIKRPKSSKAESCTIKCVGTCIRGGYGAPGEGPLNVRRPLVVFKDGFRSRHYCLVECSDICNLIRDGDDGP